MMSKLNDDWFLPVWAHVLSLLARANDRLALQVGSRRGMDDAIWKILLVGAIAALAIFVLYPLYQRVLTMGTNAVNRVGGAPW